MLWLPCFPLFTQPFSSSRYRKLSTVAGAQPVAVSFSLMSRRVAGAGQSQSASSTCSSAAESGFSLSESPYTGFTSDFLLLHLSHFNMIIPHPAQTGKR